MRVVLYKLTILVFGVPLNDGHIVLLADIQHSASAHVHDHIVCSHTCGYKVVRIVHYQVLGIWNPGTRLSCACSVSAL